MVVQSLLSYVKNCKILISAGDPKQFVNNDMNKLHKRYDGVVKVIMGTQAMIFVNDPQVASRINERGIRVYDKQQQLYVATQYFFGDSLFTAKYDNYHKHHKVLGNCFSADKMTNVVHTTLDAIQQYVSQVNTKNVRDILQDMTCIATDVLGKVTLEYDFQAVQNGLNDPLWKAEQAFSKNSPVLSFVPSVLWPLRIGFIGTMYQNADIIKQRIGEIIKSRQEKKEKNADSFIAALLEHENKELTSNEIVSNIRSILLQGIHPVARALTFCLYLLAQNPTVQQEAQQHADNIDVKGGALFKVNGHIAYIRNLLKETLRMFPVSTCQMRFTHQPVHIQKYSIPKHSWVVYNWSNREQYYENPEQFNPDRFCDDKELPSFVFSPFGVGSRACGGIAFAEYEMTTVLVMLLQQFDISVHGSYDMRTRVEHLTLRPIDDLFLSFSKRK